jgi:DNA polymerase III alpha subunit (gram-positive type)
MLFVDVETTGLSPDKHAIIEVAAIAVSDGEVIGEICLKMRPFKGAYITTEALDVNGYNSKEIMSWEHPETQIEKFIDWVDSFDCKFRFAGHNIAFDRRFLYKWFCRYGHYGTFHSRFRSTVICTYSMVKKIGKKKTGGSAKLTELCKHFDIELNNAHTAYADIKATLQLYDILCPLMPPVQITTKREFKTYQEKRRHYLDIAYVIFNPDGDVFINSKTTKDPEALRFVMTEIYDKFADDGIISEESLTGVVTE